MSLVAYHGREADKTTIIAQLAAHRAADELVQGYGYWTDGKGCAVGCTLHSGDHMEYESRFGIPVAIARLEDAIFEGLPVDLARKWPERLMLAIQPGQDLSRVHWHLMHWLLTSPSVNPGIEHETVRDAVRQCADLMADLAHGKSVTEAAVSAARSAAWSAAWSAESAAVSAARSAAESAAWSAGSAARSAARSAAWSAKSAAVSAARSAAESAAESAESAWSSIADRLIKLIEDAPMASAA